MGFSLAKKNEEHCLCGLAKRTKFGKTSEAKNRIIGGMETEVNEYPWMVRVISLRGACGGSLISNAWVLSAAHCITRVLTSASFHMWIESHFLR